MDCEWYILNLQKEKNFAEPYLHVKVNSLETVVLSTKDIDGFDIFSHNVGYKNGHSVSISIVNCFSGISLKCNSVWDFVIQVTELLLRSSSFSVYSPWVPSSYCALSPQICMQNTWATTWQNQQCGCAPSEDSDQPGHPPVWSESSLSAWRNLGSLATHWVHSEDSDQTGRMPRLIWVFAGCTLILLVLSCRSSLAKLN